MSGCTKKKAPLPVAIRAEGHESIAQKLFQKKHFPGLGLVTGFKAIEIDTGADRFAVSISSIPKNRVISGRLLPFRESSHFLAKDIEDIY